MRQPIGTWWRNFAHSQRFEILLFVGLLAVGSAVTYGAFAVLTQPAAVSAADCPSIVPVATHPAEVSARQNTLANGSAEQSDGPDTPRGWFQSREGNNQAVFAYESDDAYDGSRSLAITVSNFVDGNAKWAFAPVAVEPNAGYAWSDRYQSDVPSHVGADVTLEDGSHRYLVLGTLPASATWQSAYYTILTPLQAKTISVYHLIKQNGRLRTDDVAFGTYSDRVLTEGAISLTFDDGLRETYEHGLPLLRKYGVTTTQYIVSDPVAHPSGTYYMTEKMVKEFRDLGHEIASHTASHPNLVLQSTSAIHDQLNDSYLYLSRLTGATVTDFASPYGSTTPDIVKQIGSIYCSHRNTFSGFNTPAVIDPLNITVQDVAKDTSVDQITAWIDFAKKNRVWVVLVMHEIEEGGREYSFSPENLERVLQHITQSGIRAITVGDGLLELRSAQKALAIAPASNP